MAPRPARSWAQGLAVSVACLAVLSAIGVANGAFGFAFLVGSPFVAGYVIGRYVRVVRVLKVLAAAIVLASVIAAAATANIAGLICGVVFGAIASVPLLVGVAIGSQLAGPPRPRGTLSCVAFVA